MFWPINTYIYIHKYIDILLYCAMHWPIARTIFRLSILFYIQCIEHFSFHRNHLIYIYKKNIYIYQREEREMMSNGELIQNDVVLYKKIHK